jgi:hypothetical protein
LLCIRIIIRGWLWLIDLDLDVDAQTNSVWRGSVVWNELRSMRMCGIKEIWFLKIMHKITFFNIKTGKH